MRRMYVEFGWRILPYVGLDALFLKKTPVCPFSSTNTTESIVTLGWFIPSTDFISILSPPTARQFIFSFSVRVGALSRSVFDCSCHLMRATCSLLTALPELISSVLILVTARCQWNLSLMKSNLCQSVVCLFMGARVWNAIILASCLPGSCGINVCVIVHLYVIYVDWRFVSDTDVSLVWNSIGAIVPSLILLSKNKTICMAPMEFHTRSVECLA